MVIGPIGPLQPNQGDLVKIVDRDGLALGYGLWNPRSLISLRLLSRESEPPGPEFWDRRIAEAVALRRNVLGSTSKPMRIACCTPRETGSPA